MQDIHTVQMLDAMRTASVLTVEERAALAALGKRADVVTADQVSGAVAVWRPGGVIQPIPA